MIYHNIHCLNTKAHSNCHILQNAMATPKPPLHAVVGSISLVRENKSVLDATYSKCITITCNKTSFQYTSKRASSD